MKPDPARKGLSTTRVTLRLPVNHLKELDKIAKRQGITRNLYIRLLVADHLDKENN